MILRIVNKPNMKRISFLSSSNIQCILLFSLVCYAVMTDWVCKCQCPLCTCFFLDRCFSGKIVYIVVFVFLKLVSLKQIKFLQRESAVPFFRLQAWRLWLRS